MEQFIESQKKPETAVIVGIVSFEQPQEKAQEYLDELEFLSSTLGLETKASFTQKIDKPDPRYYVGKGKVQEISEYVRANDIDLVIFDDDLSPSQLRNLERTMKCRIYDRSLLILDIFLKRAQTSQSKTQVELARYQYLMPRLTRMWTHLERQRGGTGTRGGAGEKEIETDRRILRDQISVLKKRLEKIDKQNETQRKGRSGIVRVALVGYTNVGKSTLMNLLSKSNIHAEDKLFATVDATVRKVVIDRIPFLLSDTVGFIRKLPHHLIESFKSTLNEVVESDILLHVVDISHPAYEEQIEVVESTLSEIGAAEKPIIYVYNKIDILDNVNEEGESNDETIKYNGAVFGDHKHRTYVSAKNKVNLDDLRSKLVEEVKKKHFAIYPNYLKNEYY